MSCCGLNLKRVLKPGIGVSMIVKNEREMLPRCLRSVSGADEIVILDTGSTDGTAQAVAVLGMPNVRMITGAYQWRDDFAHARNAALEECEHEWALTIDADEWLEDGGMDILRAAIANNPDALAFNLKTLCSGGANWHYSARLYRNISRHQWHGAAHNYQNIRKALPCAAVVRYDHSPAHALDPDRTLRILTAAHHKEPDNARTLYYLASEMHRRGRYSQAALYLEACLTAPRSGYYHAEAWLLLARCLWHLRREQGNDARVACFHALEINPNFAEAARFMAEMSFPHNRSQWLAMAERATNEGVMFVREPAPVINREDYEPLGGVGGAFTDREN